MYRILALFAGVALILAALATSVGAAIIVPIAMAIAASVQRRRGRHLTTGNSWFAGVLSYSAIVTVAGILALTVGPMRGFAGQVVHAMDSAQRHPRPPPAFLRNLSTTTPEPLPPVAAKAIGVVGSILGLEFVGLLTGTLCWAGVVLARYAATGPRAPPLATPRPST